MPLPSGRKKTTKCSLEITEKVICEYYLLQLLNLYLEIPGVEGYLEECIESIITQSYRNIEILLIDDGAKGREPEICDKFAEKDSRIKVIHKPNEGLIEARRTGLKNATASYVTFVDGDDYIAHDYYEKMMQLVVAELPDLVAVSYTRVNNNHKEIKLQSIGSGIYEGDKLLDLYHNMNCNHNYYYDYGLWPSTWSKIYKTEMLRQLIKGIPKSIRIGEDSAISFPYILNCKKIVVDNSIHGYYYRNVATSMTKDAGTSLMEGLSILYNYLCDFYTSSHDPKICNQLELYRTSLIDLVLSRWMYDVKFQDIHKRSIEIKRLVDGCSLFKNLDLVLSNELPGSLMRKIYHIKNCEWRKFEKEWKKEFLSSYLHTMVRRLSKRA